MALGGVSGSGSSIYGSRNVLSGLASGMDTESMIENMTQATRLKIAQQKQKKTLLGWKQSAYQDVSTQLINFSKKYMEYPSSTNLLSSSFFDQTIVTSVGKNSELVSGSGKTNSKIEVNGVKQLAANATHSTDGSRFDSKIETKDIGMEENITVHDLSGQSFAVKYAGKRYTISLTPGADLSTVEKVAEEINKKLGELDVPGGDTLSDKLKIEVDGQGDKKSLVFKNTDNAGNELKLVGATQEFENVLGTNLSATKDGISISKEEPFKSQVIEEKKLTHQERMYDFLVDKNLTFSLNGKTQSIVVLTPEEKAEMDKLGGTGRKNKFFVQKLQEKMDKAFGEGKIKVNFASTQNKPGGGIIDTGKIGFETVDKNNILRVEGGSGELFGTHGAFGIEAGDGNRINMNRSLEKLGIQFTGDQKEKLIINGIEVGEYGKDAKLSDIIRDINAKSELGVTVKYSELTNQFVLSTKDTGANAKIQIAEGLGKKLFGEVKQTGRDAIVDVTIDGKQETITRDSNTIDINGFKLTVSGTFGDYGTDGKGPLKLDPKETVTFDSKPDTEKTFDAIKEMVEEYNKLAETVYKQLTTMPDREYQPLTDEQKKEMTKEEIEKWEEKAKAGQLFMDSQMRSLQDALRSIFSPSDNQLNVALKSIGIEPVKDHKEGAKIKLDEDKLKAALQADPEKVKNIFNAPAERTENGKAGSQGGTFTQLKGVMERFVSTSMVTPGSLVALAGSPTSASSMLNNTLQKQIDGIDKTLDTLQSRLKKEIDRYNSKFTQLEMLISQMNAQSGQLAGLMGGGGMM